MIMVEKFSYEANGYNRSEVNQFVSDVITQTEGMISSCQSQKEEIIQLKAQLAHYKSIEDKIMEFDHDISHFWILGENRND